MENNLAYIDPQKCKLCRLCVPICPTGAIQEDNFPEMTEKLAEKAKENLEKQKTKKKEAAKAAAEKKKAAKAAAPAGDSAQSKPEAKDSGASAKDANKPDDKSAKNNNEN